jgi:anthraniloyl-CoA monooxygenase
MDIACIGGGPAGLYFSLLMKKAFPAARVQVHERNRADDTFGWGVVFSDETLDNFRVADPESFAEIERNFAYWTDIDTFVGDASIRSTGHGFCGLARKRLLEIFHARCRELGVELHFQSEKSDTDFPEADLIVAADGIVSTVRERHARVFQPTLDWRKCKFCWLGTTKPLDAFTFVFREVPAGLFQVHAYPFQRGREGQPGREDQRTLSTWIVECREEVWRKAGLDRAEEADTVRFVSELFADHLEGHELLTNKSIWRSFPTVRCATWRHENIVLLGDAAHTAHFSIGSGTKLAMEDAIALVEAFRGGVEHDVPAVLAAYEESRYVDCLKTQKAAQTSLEWFEESARYIHLHPLQFKFSLMSRSKRITYDNLALRDPALVERVTRWWREQEGAPPASDGSLPSTAQIHAHSQMLVLPLPRGIAIANSPPRSTASSMRAITFRWSSDQLR